MRRAWALWAGLLLWGCRAEPEASDRTIEKMKSEQQRLAQGGQPGGPPTSQAALLTKALAAPARPEPLKVLRSQAQVGALTLEVRGAAVSQTVVGTKTSLSTADRFLMIILTASSTARAPIELGTALLKRGDETVTIARDAQHAGRGTPLTPIAIEPGAPQELVMYFEVPTSMLAPGLKLILSPAGSKVEFTLE